MQLKKFGLLAVNLTLMALTSSAFAADCSRTFKVAASDLWRESGATPLALNIDRQWLEAVAKAGGFCLSADIPETVNARRLALLESGGLDLLPSASRTPDRERYAWFSQPYRTEAIELYVRRDKAEQLSAIKHFNELAKLDQPWLAMRDNWLGPDYAQSRAELVRLGRVYEVATFREGLVMLRRKRGEALLVSEIFGRYAEYEKATDIVRLPAAIHAEPVHFMLSKASVSVAEFQQFERALAQIIEQGGLK